MRFDVVHVVGNGFRIQILVYLVLLEGVQGCVEPLQMSGEIVKLNLSHLILVAIIFLNLSQFRRIVGLVPV